MAPSDRGAARQLTRRERLALRLEQTLDRRLGPLGVFVYRRTRGGITRPWKVEALVLTTQGRRTGRPRTVVLRYFPDGDAMILAAANDGAATNPGWYHNLRACSRARVEVMGRALDVEAQELAADEGAAWWARIVAIQPEYERFRLATPRRIPIVRLVPVSS